MSYNISESTKVQSVGRTQVTAQWAASIYERARQIRSGTTMAMYQDLYGPSMLPTDYRVRDGGMMWGLTPDAAYLDTQNESDALGQQPRLTSSLLSLVAKRDKRVDFNVPANFKRFIRKMTVLFGPSLKTHAMLPSQDSPKDGPVVLLRGIYTFYNSGDEPLCIGDDIFWDVPLPNQSMARIDWTHGITSTMREFITRPYRGPVQETPSSVASPEWGLNAPNAFHPKCRELTQGEPEVLPEEKFLARALAEYAQFVIVQYEIARRVQQGTVPAQPAGASVEQLLNAHTLLAQSVIRELRASTFTKVPHAFEAPAKGPVKFERMVQIIAAGGMLSEEARNKTLRSDPLGNVCAAVHDAYRSERAFVKGRVVAAAAVGCFGDAIY